MRPSRGVGSPPRIVQLLLVRDGREHRACSRNVLHIDALKRSMVFIKFLPLFPNLAEVRQRKLGFRVLVARNASGLEHRLYVGLPAFQKSLRAWRKSVIKGSCDALSREASNDRYSEIDQWHCRSV